MLLLFFFLFTIFISLDNIFSFSWYLKMTICDNVVILVLDYFQN